MALVPDLGYSPDEARRLLAPLRNDLSIAVYACGNAFAVGAIIRVAHSFLVREIVVVGDEPYYAKASMGMHKYETIVRCKDDDAFFEHVGARPLFAVEKEHATVGLFDVPEWPRDVVLVFGSERFGLPPPVLGRAAATIAIPMYGLNHSYPVSVAAGMVLSEWGRRRYREASR
jgi:tRNA G18 (ribose-2'-O)-methylase SpoU